MKAGLRGTGTVLQCDELVQPQLQQESQGVLFLSHTYTLQLLRKKIKQTNKKANSQNKVKT